MCIRDSNNNRQNDFKAGILALLFLVCFHFLSPIPLLFNSGQEPGHQRRQRAVSLRHRSGGHTLHCKYNAVAMFLLIGRTESSSELDGWLARRSVPGCMSLVLCTILNEEASWRICRTNWFS